MQFESKTHMTKALLDGRWFRVGTSGTIHYDETYANPFRLDNTDIGNLWELYNKDIWTEVKPRHPHQDLMDSYQPGQAWQYWTSSGSYQSCKANGLWVEPTWGPSNRYRLHPHNTLIQAYNSGAKIQCTKDGNWMDTANPSWIDYIQYRIKPTTIYEWMFKAIGSTKWMIEVLLMTEDEAKNYFKDVEYRQTGRSWEVEA
jgi:hypothetical protein